MPETPREPLDRQDRRALRAIHHQFMTGRREWRANFALFLKSHAEIARSFEREGNEIRPASELFEQVMAFEPFFQLLVVSHPQCFPTLSSIQRIKRRASSSTACPSSTNRRKRLPPSGLPPLGRQAREQSADARPSSTRGFLSELAQPRCKAPASHKQLREAFIAKSEAPSSRVAASSLPRKGMPVIELSTPLPPPRSHRLFSFSVVAQQARQAAPQRSVSVQTERPASECRPVRQAVIRNEPMGDFHSCLDPNYRNKGNFVLFKLSEYGRNIYKKTMAVMPLQPACEEKSQALRAELEEIKRAFSDICFTPHSPSVVSHFIQYV